MTTSMEANKDSTSNVDGKMPRRPQIYTKRKEKRSAEGSNTKKSTPIGYPGPNDQA